MRPLSMLRRLAKELCHEEIDAEAVIEEAFIAYARQRLLGFRGGNTLSGGLDMIDMGSATVAGISWDEMLALFNDVERPASAKRWRSLTIERRTHMDR